MQAKLDITEMGKKITMVIKLRGVRRFRWRVSIATTLICWAARIAPITIYFGVDDGEPGFFYCPDCGRDTFLFYDERRRYQTITCRHCGYIFFAEMVNGEPRIIEKKDD